MISEVAILPDSFDQANDTKMLVGILRDVLNHGIFIADFQTGNWSKFIQTTYINSYTTPPVRDKLLALIRQLKDRKKIVKLTNYNHEITVENDWVEVVKLHDNDNSLEFVINGLESQTQCESVTIDKCCLVNDVLISDKWDELKKIDVVLKKTPEKFSAVLKGMFSHANVIKLIDPYLTPNGQSKMILQLCINHLKDKKEFVQGRGTIEIHTKIDDSISLNINLSRWGTMLRSLSNEANHTFKVYLWNDRGLTYTFHDRFILTNNIGVSVTHSLDVREDSEQEVTLNLLSQDSFEVHTNNFSEEDPRFKLESDPLIVVSV